MRGGAIGRGWAISIRFAWPFASLQHFACILLPPSQEIIDGASLRCWISMIFFLSKSVWEVKFGNTNMKIEQWTYDNWRQSLWGVCEHGADYCSIFNDPLTWVGSRPQTNFNTLLDLWWSSPLLERKLLEMFWCIVLEDVSLISWNGNISNFRVAECDKNRCKRCIGYVQ